MSATYDKNQPCCRIMDELLHVSVFAPVFASTFTPTDNTQLLKMIFIPYRCLLSAIKFVYCRFSITSALALSLSEISPIADGLSAYSLCIPLRAV